MNWSTLKDKLSVRLKSRNDLVGEYIEDAGAPLYANLERISRKFQRSFYNQLIVSGIGDAYDFCVDINGPNNIFYQKLRGMDAAAAAKLHKLIGVHHTIIFLRENARRDDADFRNDMKTAYDLQQRDVRNYARFSGMYRRDQSGFEIAFAKHAAAAVFRVLTLTPASLALTMYFFISSYEQFKANNPQFFEKGGGGAKKAEKAG